MDNGVYFLFPDSLVCNCPRLEFFLSPAFVFSVKTVSSSGVLFAAIVIG